MRLLPFIVLLFCCAGCAAGFDNTVPVADLINIVDPTLGRVPFGDRWVRVDAFSDAREKEALISINGRAVMPDDTVALHVTHAFEDYLRLNDYRLAQMRGPLLRGEVLEWFADVQTGFPTSKESAKAAIRILVIDDRGSTIYSAVYNGASSLQHPFLTESKVKRVLGEAMQTAIEGVLKDAGFLQAVDEARRSLREN